MVTAMPGGPAAKAADRYEDLWMVSRMCDLLEGLASRIQPEPPGIEGLGIEFEIDIDGVTWGEQAKSSAKNWTISRLQREGILTAAQTQVGLGRRFRLVTAGNPSRLGTLAHRARITESFDEYTAVLGKDQRAELTKVTAVWDVQREEAWHLLKGVEVKHIPADALDELVRVKLRSLFGGDHLRVVADFDNFSYEHMHVAFTGSPRQRECFVDVEFPPVAGHFHKERV